MTLLEVLQDVDQRLLEEINVCPLIQHGQDVLLPRSRLRDGAKHVQGRNLRASDIDRHQPRQGPERLEARVRNARA